MQQNRDSLTYELFCKQQGIGWYYIAALTLEDAQRHLGQQRNIARSHRKYPLTEALKSCHEYNHYKPTPEMDMKMHYE